MGLPVSIQLARARGGERTIQLRLDRAVSHAHVGEASFKTHLGGFCREGNASHTYDLITTIRL